MDLQQQILDLGRRARKAARDLARRRTEQKNAALLAMADEIVASQTAILSANEKEIKKTDALRQAMTASLAETVERITAMAGAVRQVQARADPVSNGLGERAR